MSDILRELSAETWKAAAEEAYRRAGIAVADGKYDLAIEWQNKAKSYAHRGMMMMIGPIILSIALCVPLAVLILRV